MKRNPMHSPEHAAYLRQLQRKEQFVRCCRYGILIGFILLWEVAAGLGWIDAFVTSSPSRLIDTIAGLLEKGELWRHVGVTLLETVVSFTVGTLLGTLIAVMLWWSPTLCNVLEPYLVVLNALPKVALGPILIVWIGATMGSIIAMGLLISLVVTIMTVLGGFLEIGREKQLLMRTLGAGKMQIFTKAIFPASIPTILSALKISVGMSWVGVIMGEYLVSKAGLGYLIVYGGQVFQLDLVMASVVILCLLAALMYLGVAMIEKRAVKWRPKNA